MKLVFLSFSYLSNPNPPGFLAWKKQQVRRRNWIPSGLEHGYPYHGNKKQISLIAAISIYGPELVQVYSTSCKAQTFAYFLGEVYDKVLPKMAAKTGIKETEFVILYDNASTSSSLSHPNP